MVKLIQTTFLSLLAGILLSYSLLSFADTQQSSEPQLSERLTQGQHEIADLMKTWQKTRSNMSRAMILQQLSSRMKELTNIVSDTVDEDKNSSDKPPEEQGKNLHVADIKTMLSILRQQRSSSPQLIRDLFHSYESAELTDKPLNWLTVSVAMHYQSSLYIYEQQLLKLLNKQQRAPYLQRYRYQLHRYANDLASFLKASINQQEQMNDELSSLSKSMHQQMSDRLTMQQRISKTISQNITMLIPVLKDYDMDVSQYSQLTFSASGELTDLVLNSSGVLSFFKSFFVNGDQWLITTVKSVLPRTIIFILVMALFYGLSRLVKLLVSKMVHSKHSRLSTLVQEFFISMAGKSVIVMGILVAFSQIGVDLAPVLAGLGVAGIVIGFALQDTLSNFASGMMILIYRPFDVGDYVDAGGVSGKVNYMSLVNTTIRTFDNQKIMVPNNKIWGSTINNITAERVRRVDMEFSIAYSDDIELAERVLKEIIEAHQDVLREPEPTIKLMRLGESSIDFIVRPWVKTEAYWDVYWDVTRTVKLRFDKEGLSIPFPQRDIHVYHDSNNQSQ
ncbi:mechanosensitive ion channel domain-containing protein [Celerinatantimonas sp. MCCC 1A17872]|uniref:mechanosensitive ion channel domain-containing protein n=1 Tax=Celerinatantimonas sp. MCCC 1A17872 TaxID=3177514 RepID=UPI0038C90D9A